MLPRSTEPVFKPFEGNPHDEEIMTRLNREKVRMDNEQMVRIIREHFIEPPSTRPYRLDNPEKLDFSSGQAPFVDNRLGFMVRYKTKFQTFLYQVTKSFIIITLLIITKSFIIIVYIRLY